MYNFSALPFVASNYSIPFPSPVEEIHSPSSVAVLIQESNPVESKKQMFCNDRCGFGLSIINMYFLRGSVFGAQVNYQIYSPALLRGAEEFTGI